ncbi:MAG TPA: NusA-like transcription termination signal-binding factor [Thermoplasmatales archaeon]|nr:NusA-like transcription termination signal-binding factor [Thermoplasmatales archaeon]HEX16962.1 NusA-like transcription termination signal-binding factor [Thermoplasmatales archaeon]
MAERVISTEDIHKMRLASSLTKADIIDCIEDEDTLIFIVSKGFLGLAIGKNARNVERLREIFRKNVRFVELDDDEKRFIINLFKPFKVEDVRIEDVGNRKVAKLKVSPTEKSKVIGKGGRNVRIAREIAQRHSSIDDIQIQ